MGYSDDTAEFMFSGHPTMTELMSAYPKTCESCHRHPHTTRVTFGDGKTFWVCDSCRPFDPRTVKVHRKETNEDQSDT